MLTFVLLVSFVMKISDKLPRNQRPRFIASAILRLNTYKPKP